VSAVAAAQQTAPKSSAPNAAAQQPPPKKSAPAPKKQSSAPLETDQERDARLHYKTALAALANNDLPAAEEELKAAAKFAPKNALILYNLAIVQSKREEIKEGFASLQQAETLGIPADSKNAAEDLHASLQYKVKKKTEEDEARTKEQALGDRFQWLEGSWYENDRKNDGPILRQEFATLLVQRTGRANFEGNFHYSLSNAARGFVSSCEEDWDISGWLPSPDNPDRVLLHITPKSVSREKNGHCEVAFEDNPKDTWVDVTKEAPNTVKFSLGLELQKGR
jgi:hypothetical protein